MTLVERRSSEGLDGPRDEDPPAAVEQIVRAVAARTDTARPEMERMVVQELARFRGSRVTQYVPLLVERAVLLRLRVPPVASESDRGGPHHPPGRA